MPPVWRVEEQAAAPASALREEDHQRRRHERAERPDASGLQAKRPEPPLEQGCDEPVPGPGQVQHFDDVAARQQGGMGGKVKNIVFIHDAFDIR